MAGTPTTSIGSLLNSGWNFLFGGPSSPGGQPAGLISGLTGNTNPLFDIMAILSFINEGQLTQEQSDFMNKVLSAQGGALNTTSDPNKLAAWRTALTPHGQTATDFANNMNALTPQGMSPGTYGQIANDLTGTLSGPFVANALNPVNAELAAEGQNQSGPYMQYVSEQALAPYSLQLSEMGQAGANQMLNQFMTEQGFGFSGAQDLLNQLLSEQSMGQGLTQFGLSLPAQTPYSIPNFSVVNPSNTSDLFSLLSSNPTTGPGGTFNPTSTNWLQNLLNSP